MKKLIATLLAGATSLTAAVTLAPTAASATPPISYWRESTGGLAVNGTYRSVVGDFAEGPEDDILWNSNTSATDHLWTSNGDGTFAKAPLTVQPPANAIPLVGDFLGDDKEDIFWYGPGSAPDAMWQASGGSFRTGTGRVNGTYDAKVLDDATGKDAIVFYDTSSGRGSIWSWGDRGSFVQRSITGPAGATLLTGRFSDDGCADLYLFANSGHDPLVELDCDGLARQTLDQTLVTDSRPYVGQFSVGRDAQDDILWVNPAGINTMLDENEVNGRFSRSHPMVPYTGTLLRVANGYAAIARWDTTTGQHHIWFQVPGGYSFNADLANTPMPRSYRPIVGAFVGSGEDIFWYQAGSAPERLFSMPG